MLEEKPKIIMAVGAHHDDNELVAGTLAKHKEAGWKIVSVVVTDGKYIKGEISEKHIDIRENESLTSAAILDMQCCFLRFPEGQLKPHEEDLLIKLIENIRKYKPAAVITHPAKDFHYDHIIVSECVRYAVLQSWSPFIKTESAPISSPRLYYADAWFVPFEPDEYVDISDYMKLKLDMLSCHKSQLDDEDPENKGLLEFSRLKNRVRGIEAGVDYAEAFRLVPNLGVVRLSNILK